MAKAHLLAGVSANAVARSRGAVRNISELVAAAKKLFA